MKLKKISIIFTFYLLFNSIAWCQLSKLELIEKKIDSLAAIQDKVYHELFLELKTTGFNDTLKHSERIDALILIGKLRTTESINFLLDTISHYIFTGDYTGDVDIVRANPCFYGLFKFNGDNIGNDLFLFPYVMESLKKDIKEEEEIRLLSKLLKYAIPRTSILLDYLEFRLRAALPPQKDNLKRVIKNIKQG